MQDEQILPVVVLFSQLLCSVGVGSIHITHLSILRSQPKLKLAVHHRGNLPILSVLLAHSTQEVIGGGLSGFSALATWLRGLWELRKALSPLV